MSSDLTTVAEVDGYDRSALERDYEPVALEDAAAELGYGVRHIRHLCEQGVFGRKMGEKHWVIFRWEVEAYKKLPRKKPGRQPQPGRLGDG